MTPIDALMWFVGAPAALYLAARILIAALPPRRNWRRTDVLGKPVVDPRSSIEQFRRIHTP